MPSSRRILIIAGLVLGSLFVLLAADVSDFETAAEIRSAADAHAELSDQAFLSHNSSQPADDPELAKDSSFNFDNCRTV